jgi:hypothetical protein
MFEVRPTFEPHLDLHLAIAITRVPPVDFGVSPKSGARLQAV